MNEPMTPGTRVLVLQMPELRKAAVGPSAGRSAYVQYESGPGDLVPTEWIHPSKITALAAIVNALDELTCIEDAIRNGEYDEWLTPAASVAADGDGREN